MCEGSRNCPELPNIMAASIIQKWKEFRTTRTFLRAPSDQTERAGKRVWATDVTVNQLRDIKGIQSNSFRFYRAWSARSIICLLVLVVMNKTEPSNLWEDRVAKQQMGPCSEYIFNLKLLWTLKFKRRDYKPNKVKLKRFQAPRCCFYCEALAAIRFEGRSGAGEKLMFGFRTKAALCYLSNTYTCKYSQR